MTEPLSSLLDDSPHPPAAVQYAIGFFVGAALVGSLFWSRHPAEIVAERTCLLRAFESIDRCRNQCGEQRTVAGDLVLPARSEAQCCRDCNEDELLLQIGRCDQERHQRAQLGFW